MFECRNVFKCKYNVVNVAEEIIIEHVRIKDIGREAIRKLQFLRTDAPFPSLYNNRRDTSGKWCKVLPGN